MNSLQNFNKAKAAFDSACDAYELLKLDPTATKEALIAADKAADLAF